MSVKGAKMSSLADKLYQTPVAVEVPKGREIKRKSKKK